MIAQLPARPICLPPAPVNGGPLESAPAKVGQWAWTPKVDDRRVVIHTPSSTVWNQYGQLSVAHRDLDKFQVALDRIKTVSVAAEWLDAGLMEYRHDLMRGCIIVFDLIESTLSQQRRYGVLRQMFPQLPYDVSRLLSETAGQVRDSVYLISQWDNVESTADAINRQSWLKIQNESIGHKFFEGLVAKRMASTYQFGQRPKQTTGDWVKHRFDQ